MAATILEGDYLDNHQQVEPVREVSVTLTDYVDETIVSFQLLRTGMSQAKVPGFAEVLAAKDAEDGISALYVNQHTNFSFETFGLHLGFKRRV